MSGFILEDRYVQEIKKRLPYTNKLEAYKSFLNPESLSMSLKFLKSDVPIASVCFHDAISTLSNANYAVSEALANKAYYDQQRNPPLPPTSIWMREFYFTDAAIRLYSSAEHLANGIIYMMDLKDEDLKDYSQSRSSLHITVGTYLLSNHRESAVTKELIKIKESPDWQKVVEIRNDCIHEQPPTVEGMGIIYHRKRRWEESEDGRKVTMGLGGGDKPKYKIEEIEESVLNTLFLFVEVTESIVVAYQRMFV